MSESSPEGSELVGFIQVLHPTFSALPLPIQHPTQDNAPLLPPRPSSQHLVPSFSLPSSMQSFTADVLWRCHPLSQRVEYRRCQHALVLCTFPLPQQPPIGAVWFDWLADAVSARTRQATSAGPLRHDSTDVLSPAAAHGRGGGIWANSFSPRSLDDRKLGIGRLSDIPPLSPVTWCCDSSCRGPEEQAALMPSAECPPVSRWWRCVSLAYLSSNPSW